MANTCTLLDSGNWSASATHSSASKTCTPGAFEVISVAENNTTGAPTIALTDGTNTWTEVPGSPQNPNSLVRFHKFTCKPTTSGPFTVLFTASGLGSATVSGAYIWEEIKGTQSASEIQSNGAAVVVTNTITATLPNPTTAGSCTHLSLSLSVTQTPTWPSGFTTANTEANLVAGTLYTGFNPTNTTQALVVSGITAGLAALVADEIAAGGGAATGGLFLPPLLNGLGAGGPFFRNPLG